MSEQAGDGFVRYLLEKACPVCKQTLGHKGWCSNINVYAKESSMTPDQYVVEAMRSLKRGQDLHYDLNHSLHGLISESGEIADTVKRHIIYEQPLDVDNLEEEIGDLMWYVAVMCYVNNISLEKAMKRNIDKLLKRYPEKFTTEAAVKRADKQ